MDRPHELRQSFRVGVFTTLRAADLAVRRLLDAGFTTERITVICSDEAKERHFRQFEHEDPAGDHADRGIAAGVTIGAVAGGLTAITFGAAIGAVPLVIAGAAGLSGGSALGGFLGAMLTRGSEKEPSNFYDQAVQRGDILVAVEDRSPQADANLARAAKILADCGAGPIELPEG
jgi:hypothetical protein